jgi:hypothetical protein
MQRSLLAIAGAALAFIGCPAVAETYSYDLDTDFGPVHLEVHSDSGHVHGYYPNYNGEIFAEMTSGDRIDGIWVQPGGDHPCRESRHGSFQWGRLIFENPRGHHMEGVWSYCGAEPTQAWNGHFRH